MPLPLSDPARRRPSRLPLAAVSPRQLRPGPLETPHSPEGRADRPSASLPPLPVRPSSLSQDTASSVRLLDSGLGDPHVPTSCVDHEDCHLKRPRKTDPRDVRIGLCVQMGHRRAARAETRSLTCVRASSWGTFGPRHTGEKAMSRQRQRRGWEWPGTDRPQNPRRSWPPAPGPRAPGLRGSVPCPNPAPRLVSCAGATGIPHLACGARRGAC